jgi:hypothetical protein
MRTRVLLLLAAGFATSCSQPVGAPNTLPKSPSPTASMTPVSQTAAPSPSPTASTFARPQEEHGEAEVNGYHYSYKTDGLKIDVMFEKRPLPQNGDVVVSAIREIIGRSYGDKVAAVPQIVGSGSAQTIRVQGKSNTYLIVPVKSNNGDIRSLIITQLAHQ